MPNPRPWILRIILGALLAFGGVAAEGAAPRQLWEEVSAERVEPQQSAEENGVDLTVRDGVVYLTVTRQTVVEVFTILGQPVGRQTLRPGIYRLHLTTRGIYVLRAGGMTRRITL